MKRVLSVLVATVLMLCMIPGVSAAGIESFNPNAKLFVNSENQSIASYTATVKAGESISIPLGTSVFKSVTPAVFADATDQQLARLKLYVAGNKSAEFYKMFTPVFFKHQGWVFLGLTANAVTSDMQGQFQVGLTYNNQTTTAQNQLTTLNLSVKAPLPGITGLLQSDPIPSFDPIVKMGGSYSLTLPAQQFQYSGSDQTINMAKINQYGITATTDAQQYLPAKIVADATGKLSIQITPAANAPLGTYKNVRVLLNSTNLGSVVFANMPTFTLQNQNPAAGNKITGIDPNARLGETANGIWGRVAKNGYLLPSGESMEALTIHAGDEITLEFDTDFFLWENGKPSPAAGVSSSMIRQGKITVKMLSGRNNNIVDSYALYYDGGRAYVKIKFVERFVSTKEKEFDFAIALAYNGTAVRDAAANLSGTIDNPYIYVYSDYDYIDLSYGEIAIAEESVRSIDVDLGEGVVIHTRMVKGKSYYGTVSIEPDAADIRMMDRYRDIEMVYSLQTVGLNASGKVVRIEAPARYHVYNRNLEYLGTTSDKLPYATKYYLSSRKLAVVSDSEDDVSKVDGLATTPGSPSSANNNISDDSPVPTGATPGGTPAQNSNFNPVNGR